MKKKLHFEKRNIFPKYLPSIVNGVFIKIMSDRQKNIHEIMFILNLKNLYFFSSLFSQRKVNFMELQIEKTKVGQFLGITNS